MNDLQRKYIILQSIDKLIYKGIFSVEINIEKKMSFCIGILGDVMLDVEHLVTTSRYAPEDLTIPVYRIHSTKNRLGGAANVAKNLARLGCGVEMISVIGADTRGEMLRDMLIRDHIDCRLWVEDGRPTTTKTRLYDQETQKLLHRHDEETSEDISMSLEEEMLKYIQEKMASWDAIVISDYNKGLITDRLCRRVIEMANQRRIPTFIDPKKGFLKYKGCFCIKPNLLEAQIMTGKTEMDEMMESLCTTLECKNTVITCGKDGMYINNLWTHIRGRWVSKMVDATGSGDIVLSVLVYAFLTHGDMIRACEMANNAAAKGVMYVGNYTPTKEDLEDYIEPVLRCRVAEDCVRLASIRKTSRNIVFTNGCFDVIHSAHIRLLHFARRLGDILVVGINSDESVGRLKPNRPINHLEERCRLLQSLNIIDYLVVFDQDTPLDLLKHLRPEIMVKGGDYTEDQIVGREYCGRVMLFEYAKGISSSNTIHKIKTKTSLR
jgi:D-beta-D-heptose 7-phosphate kinase/D-beta-D-heptose 1-phosphate adenosyltransferase